MKSIFLVVAIVMLMTGCGESGPLTTNTKSTAFQSTAEKVDFLEQYVRFDRNYHELDFEVIFHNGGEGMVPSPSEWNIKIIAIVPENELSLWTSGLSPISPPELNWADNVTTTIDYANVSKWFRKGNVVTAIMKKCVGPFRSDYIRVESS